MNTRPCIKGQQHLDSIDSPANNSHSCCSYARQTSHASAFLEAAVSSFHQITKAHFIRVPEVYRPDKLHMHPTRRMYCTWSSAALCRSGPSLRMRITHQNGKICQYGAIVMSVHLPVRCGQPLYRLCRCLAIWMAVMLRLKHVAVIRRTDRNVRC